MGNIYGKTSYFDTTVVENAIKNCGITKQKLSTMVLGKDASYLSNAVNTGKINTELLKKLCEFLSLEFDKTVVVMEDKQTPQKEQKQPEVTVQNIPQLDTLILGLNQLYEIQKLQNEGINNLLEQIKITNTKINRLENALGQIVNHSIAIKDTLTNQYNNIRDIKSSTATINGRVRDILNQELKEKK